MRNRDPEVISDSEIQRLQEKLTEKEKQKEKIIMIIFRKFMCVYAKGGTAIPSQT